MYIHSIDVSWFKCDFPECSCKFKTKSDLNRHFRSFHTPEGPARQKREEHKISKWWERNNQFAISFYRYKRQIVYLRAKIPSLHKYKRFCWYFEFWQIFPRFEIFRGKSYYGRKLCWASTRQLRWRSCILGLAFATRGAICQYV